MDKPNLIEKNVYDHVLQSLLLCHTNRILFYFYNEILFVLNL